MAGFSLSIVELRPHRVDEAVDSKPPPDGGSIARRGRESEMVVSTQKPFTLRVALVDGQGLVVHADVHVPLKAQLLYENGKVVEALNEPTLLGADALLEHGVATFDKLQIRVLSSQRQLQRFRVHVAAKAGAFAGASAISAPLRTITKIRPRSTLAATAASTHTQHAQHAQQSQHLQHSQHAQHAQLSQGPAHEANTLSNQENACHQQFLDPSCSRSHTSDNRAGSSNCLSGDSMGTGGVKRTLPADFINESASTELEELDGDGQQSLWRVVDEHGKLLKMLKAQHDEILGCLRQIQTDGRASNAVTGGATSATDVQGTPSRNTTARMNAKPNDHINTQANLCANATIRSQAYNNTRVYASNKAHKSPTAEHLQGERADARAGAKEAYFRLGESWSVAEAADGRRLPRRSASDASTKFQGRL
uniref:Uncharacterized protein n=1 Tax=Chrysotila carterae TaxID=13221 RepID=A0A6S9ZUL5_CHRCT